ncbi:unnamed protein product [Urochloa decumbens]|uniref:Uncharacterized protein n=1 Tax=Urochloa decumbens TaxID=240449 RepID=A0ABC8YGJ6_9POAL
MARPIHAMLPSILVAFLLFQVSHCSRPLAPEERQPRVPTAPPADAHRDAADTGKRRPVTVVAITLDDGGQRRTTTSADDDDGAAPPSMLTASSSRDKGQGGADVGSSGHRSAPLAGPQVLQRSKLARRFLAGVVEGADSAARASCHSSDVHISCTPPSEH